jgi:hypothetical protein
MSGHERYADWDGAYVMGALSIAERHEYEDHLATCPICAEAVAELGPLPGLLGRLSPEDAEPLLAEAEEMPARLATPVVVPMRRRRGLRVALAAVAAAAVVAVAVPVTIHATSDGGGSHPTETVALQQIVPGPLTATVSLTSVKWGTKVEMTCVYADGYGVQRPYSLYVLDAAGHATLVSRWHAGPGDTAHTAGSTDLSTDAIDSIQLRSENGTVLLSAQA